MWTPSRGSWRYLPLTVHLVTKAFHVCLYLWRSRRQSALDSETLQWFHL